MFAASSSHAFCPYLFSATTYLQGIKILKEPERKERLKGNTLTDDVKDLNDQFKLNKKHKMPLQKKKVGGLAKTMG